MFTPDEWLELQMTSASFLLILIYHWHLARQVRRRPLQTAMGITNHVRTQWVRSVMQEKNNILAVQTLRNGLMAANFLASNAILISLG
ncbi:MAG: DUF599 domain-containing protein, partial [Desulfosarcinaceae bacterium]